MAESILRALGGTRFHAFSAGHVRSGALNPYMLDFLSQHHLPVAGLWSKTLDHFCLPDAPRVDFIITLCDGTASEHFRGWPGDPFVAHWSIETGKDADDALRDNFWTLMRRIKIFTSLPHGKLSRRLLERRALTLQPSYL